MCSVKRIIASIVLGALALSLLSAQTQSNPQKPRQEVTPVDTLRITAELVQTDVVVTDKNDQIVRDLELQDFELYENGKKQDLQFMEFVSTDLNAPPRIEALSGSAKINGGRDESTSRDLTRQNVKRVIAFVVDDVTIPSEDLARLRETLSDFVDHKMANGDLVAIVRTVGGTGLLEQFTSDREILRRAVAQIGARSVPPYMAFGGPEPGRVTKVPSPGGAHDTSENIGDMNIDSGLLPDGSGVNQVPRAFLALSISNLLVNSLREIPGRKNLVLFSGGLPMFDLSKEGRFSGEIGQLFQQLTDNATRSDVVINTLDVRGLNTGFAGGGIASDCRAGSRKPISFFATMRRVSNGTANTFAAIRTRRRSAKSRSPIMPRSSRARPISRSPTGRLMCRNGNSTLPMTFLQGSSVGF